MEIEDERERERKKMTKVCTVPFYQRHLILFFHFYFFFSSFYLLRLRSAYTMSRLDDDSVIQFIQGTFEHSIKIARFKRQVISQRTSPYICIYRYTHARSHIDGRRKHIHRDRGKNSIVRIFFFFFFFF